MAPWVRMAWPAVSFAANADRLSGVIGSIVVCAEGRVRARLARCLDLLRRLRSAALQLDGVRATIVRGGSQIRLSRNGAVHGRTPRAVKVGRQGHPLRHLHIADPKTGPSRGLFLYLPEVFAGTIRPSETGPPVRNRSPNAHRLFLPAPRSRRDGFKTPIYFNELTGSRCARVSLVPACLKAGGDATRAAWWLVCLGSFARSL